MSQRVSGYERKPNDLYETPEWVTEALLPHLRIEGYIWEPAAGNGKIVRVLSNRSQVYASDIRTGKDFLTVNSGPAGHKTIVTNPPYNHATEFLIHALRLTQDSGVTAMLLRTDFDHAKTRQFLFGKCPQFSKKLVLTKRIKWFKDSKGQPSYNHAWFIWDWKHKGPPVLAYGP